jgi:hypothetical protein
MYEGAVGVYYNQDMEHFWKADNWLWAIDSSDTIYQTKYFHQCGLLWVNNVIFSYKRQSKHFHADKKEILF